MATQLLPAPEPKPNSLMELPTLVELLGTNWENRSCDEALAVVRAWLQLNPAGQHTAIIGALNRIHILALKEREQLQNLGQIRAYLISQRPRLRNVGPVGWQALRRLFEIPVKVKMPTPAPASVEELTERALQLCRSLTPEQLTLWLDLGQKMAAHTTQEQE